MGVYVFLGPKYMWTYYRAPKAREQRSSDCTRLCARAWSFMYLLDLNKCVPIIERRRRGSSGRRSAREATSRACECAWVFMYLLDLNICILIIECQRHNSSGRRTARG